MAKRKFKLTEREREKLFQAYQLCRDGPTRTRYQAVKLYSEGYLEMDIERITGCSRDSLININTLNDWEAKLNEYLADLRAGIDALKNIVPQDAEERHNLFC